MILPSPQEEKLFVRIPYAQFHSLSPEKKSSFTGIIVKPNNYALSEEAIYKGWTYKTIWSDGTVEYWLKNKTISYNEYLSHTKEFQDLVKYKNLY